MWIEGTCETITNVPENPCVVLRNFVPRLSGYVPHMYSPFFRLEIKRYMRNVYSPSMQPDSVWSVRCLEVIEAHNPYYAGPCLNVGKERANYQRIPYSLFQYLYRASLILTTDQQMHNYFTNYHTPTCFDTIVPSSDSLQSIPCQVTPVFHVQLSVIQFTIKLFHTGFMPVLIL
jgi:hypothetical protein